jgi:hypothetical protein
MTIPRGGETKPLTKQHTPFLKSHFLCLRTGELTRPTSTHTMSDVPEVSAVAEQSGHDSKRSDDDVLVQLSPLSLLCSRRAAVEAGMSGVSPVLSNRIRRGSLFIPYFLPSSSLFYSGPRDRFQFWQTGDGFLVLQPASEALVSPVSRVVGCSLSTTVCSSPG